MNTKIILGFVALLVIGGLVFFGLRTQNTGKGDTTANQFTGTAPGQNSEPSTQPQEFPQNYVVYSEQAVVTAQEKGKTLLFFHANWCPTCKAAEKDILENAGDIPADLTIVKTDFDTQKELKEKYNVVVQHTYVQIDADGNEITQWRGGGVDTILQNLE